MVLTSGHLLLVLGPVLAVGAFTALLAMAAGLGGFYPAEMLTIAGVVGSLVGLMTVFVIYRRLSERRASEDALRSMEARFGGIVESAMDPIITVDQTQRIVQFNAAAEAVFRWPRAAVIGQPLDLLIPERLRASHAAHIERFVQTGSSSRRVGRSNLLLALRANGEEFPIEASISQYVQGNQRLLTVILRDITDRLRGESERARNEARLHGIVESAMDAIIIIDAEQRILLFNQAAEVVFGCPRDQAVGAPLTWFIPERYRSGHAAHVHHFGEAGTSSRRMGASRIVTGLRRNGEEFPIDASISQVTEGGEKFYTVILRDVTERVKSEEALRQSREELRELAIAASSVREQEKSRIARELHDELAQSLTALKMDTAWLLERLPTDNELMLDKVRAMQGLLDTTVASTRRISADLRPLMLDDLGLVPAAEWLAQNFTQRSGIPCELSVDPGLALEDPHATAIFRILQESLTNVAKHAQATRVDAHLEANGDQLVLMVNDNGLGFSTSNPRKPNSYGLMGLRERAYLLGGTVDVDSAPGKGTHIVVRIPHPDSVKTEVKPTVKPAREAGSDRKAGP